MGSQDLRGLPGKTEYKLSLAIIVGTSASLLDITHISCPLNLFASFRSSARFTDEETEVHSRNYSH